MAELLLACATGIRRLAHFFVLGGDTLAEQKRDLYWFTEKHATCTVTVYAVDQVDAWQELRGKQGVDPELAGLEFSPDGQTELPPHSGVVAVIKGDEWGMSVSHANEPEDTLATG